ncbi:hypothetical protein [Parvibaculum sp.]|uniref:hypothetical protein n=1 Tax=Parvibaculum sp. TaxID=2024848 RepID=UPI00271A390A|nr:hypothetical protein [Parvibaculum sp.]MDO9126274.1 hypothetical protein [Parvibaculum sp.]MDP1628575.1 hypothetical protein [Parvibaculum sp.]MDP2150071.1 hypothetical protein [Parvibaculum sp.]MDP3330089.1 hypothetical protein [Parvibaculum sp.]
MHIYTLKAESPAALAAMLDAAQAGKPRPFVTWDGGSPVFDGARIVYPVPETVAGEPQPDPETGEPVTPFEPTGLWLCEVRLREADAELAAMIEA